MRNKITFGGTDLSTYGVYISGSNVYNSPERQYETVAIPGRHGALLTHDKRMENVELVYPAFMYANFASNMASLRAYLLSKIGYQRLEDTYHPDEYRMAFFRGPIENEMTQALDAGQFELTFEAKPQRWLKSGETQVSFTSTTNTITNPTLFPSSPLIRAYGTGSFTIGSTTVTISSANNYTDIDSEVMECYNGSTSRNRYVSFSGTDFPLIQPGQQTITLDGITQVKITPRWWTV